MRSMDLGVRHPLVTKTAPVPALVRLKICPMTEKSVAVQLGIHLLFLATQPLKTLYVMGEFSFGGCWWEAGPISS